MDLSIPSNVDNKLKNLENVTVVNLDELSQLTNAALKKRQKFIPEAIQILNEIQNEFLQWVAHRKFAPTLKALKKTLLNGQLSQKEETDEFSQIVYKLTESRKLSQRKPSLKVDEDRFINSMLSKMSINCFALVRG